MRGLSIGARVAAPAAAAALERQGPRAPGPARPGARLRPRPGGARDRGGEGGARPPPPPPHHCPHAAGAEPAPRAQPPPCTRSRRRARSRPCLSRSGSMPSSVSPSRHRVTASEPVGPYTLLRLERGDLEPGAPGQFFMLEAPGRLLPRPFSLCLAPAGELAFLIDPVGAGTESLCTLGDRKSTRLNSSHITISYAVFCLKKKKQNKSRQ